MPIQWTSTVTTTAAPPATPLHHHHHAAPPPPYTNLHLNSIIAPTKQHEITQKPNPSVYLSCLNSLTFLGGRFGGWMDRSPLKRSKELLVSRGRKNEREDARRKMWTGLALSSVLSAQPWPTGRSAEFWPISAAPRPVGRRPGPPCDLVVLNKADRAEAVLFLQFRYFA